MTLLTPSGIAISVTCGDVLSFSADVLALKHAGGKSYGADKQVVTALKAAGVSAVGGMPTDGQAWLHESRHAVKAELVLFLGTPDLYAFDYGEIRKFARRVLSVLHGRTDVRHVALTLHGTGAGLDESEAFRAEIAGLLDAIIAGEYPSTLEQITIVENSEARANRLASLLSSFQPSWRGAGESARTAFVRKALDSAGTASKEKPHVFVAMPFAAEFDDLFHYGIQGAVNAAGFLCERADLASFTGDVIEWVKNRIASAKLLVADLSSANPNVYLEVGYAWGRDIPTVLLARSDQELKFDVRGQRCLIYKNIRHLEELLSNELQTLRVT
jgi:hypothetical protein